MAIHIKERTSHQILNQVHRSVLLLAKASNKQRTATSVATDPFSASYTVQPTGLNRVWDGVAFY
jgi:hypothetical protein